MLGVLERGADLAEAEFGRLARTQCPAATRRRMLESAEPLLGGGGGEFAVL